MSFAKKKIDAYHIFWWVIISLVICIIFFILRGDHGSGDGAIHIIYGYNLQRTGRLAFNSFQLSSGSSSPTWTLLLALMSSFVERASMFLATEILAIFLYCFGACCAAYYGLKKHSPLMGWILLGSYIFINIRALSLGLQWEDALLSTVVLSIFTMLVFYQNSLSTIRIILISALAGLAILSRPQEIVPVSIISLYFLIYNFSEFKKNSSAVILGAFCSLFIGGFYFIWCRIYTGSFLPFSVEARYQLKESLVEKSVLDLCSLLLNKTLDPILLIPCIVCFTLMAVNKKLDKTFLGCIILFLVTISVTLYLTNGFNFERYVVASNAIIFIACAEYFIKISKTLEVRKSILFLSILAFGLVISLSALIKPGNGYSWQDIVKANECEERNAAALNSVVMLHEVQNRWCLDKSINVIAMDGITDGIMTPAINSPMLVPKIIKENKVQFIELYKIFITRHFIAKSIIGRATQAIIIDKSPSYEEMGIVFSRINGIPIEHSLIKISYK